MTANNSKLRWRFTQKILVAQCVLVIAKRCLSLNSG